MLKSSEQGPQNEESKPSGEKIDDQAESLTTDSKTMETVKTISQEDITINLESILGSKEQKEAYLDAITYLKQILDENMLTESTKEHVYKVQDELLKKISWEWQHGMRPRALEKQILVLDKAGLVDHAVEIFVEQGNAWGAGWLLRGVGQEEKVRKMYEHAAEQYSTNRDTYDKAVQIWEELGELEKAEEVDKKFGRFGEAGWRREKLGEFERAANLYEQGGKYVESARMWKKLGNTEKALENYTRAATEQEEYGKSQEAKGISKGSYRWGAPYMEEAGNIWREAGELEKAAKAYQEATLMHGRSKSYNHDGEMHNYEFDRLTKKTEEFLKNNQANGL